MVEKEQVHAPFAVGSAVITRIYRAACGRWTAEFDLNFRVQVDDTRDVYIRRIVAVGASEQRGRRRGAQQRKEP